MAFPLDAPDQEAILGRMESSLTLFADIRPARFGRLRKVCPTIVLSRFLARDSCGAFLPGTRSLLLALDFVQSSSDVVCAAVLQHELVHAWLDATSPTLTLRQMAIGERIAVRDMLLWLDRVAHAATLHDSDALVVTQLVETNLQRHRHLSVPTSQAV